MKTVLSIGMVAIAAPQITAGQFEVRVLDASRGLVEVVSQFSHRGPEPLVLRDPAVNFYDGEGAGLAGFPDPGVEVLEESWASGAGELLSPTRLSEGRVAISGSDLELHRRLRIRNRSQGVDRHHPFASTMASRSAVLSGVDLFWVPEEPRTAEDPLELSFDVPPNWRVVTPWEDGGGPQTWKELTRNFFVLGSELAVESLPCGGNHWSWVVPSDPGKEVRDRWWPPFERVGTRLCELFGPLPQSEHFLIVMQPVEGTHHRATLFDRGANGNHSLVAYLDDRPAPLYAEHPLSVLIHETFHWWNPRAMNFRPGAAMPWWTEGITTYYEYRLLLETSVIDFDFFAQAMLDCWNRGRDTSPQRRQVTLEQASSRFAEDAFSRRVTYYRGAALGLALDVHLRSRSATALNLDDVVRTLLREGRDGEQRAASVPRVIDQLGGKRALGLLNRWMTSREPPDLGPELARLGFEVIPRERALIGINLDDSAEPTVSITNPETEARRLLKNGDVILAIGGQATPDHSSFVAAVAALEPGTKAPVRIRRGPEELELSLPLGSRPAPLAVPVGGLDATQELLRRSFLEAP